MLRRPMTFAPLAWALCVCWLSLATVTAAGDGTGAPAARGFTPLPGMDDPGAPAPVAAVPAGERVYGPEDLPLHEYARLLDQHMRDGVVNYSSLRGQDREALDRLAGIVARTDLDRVRNVGGAGATAWLVNASNILTLKMVVDALPVESVRDLGDPMGAEVEVAGRRTTLGALQQDLLGIGSGPLVVRGAGVDPRLHFVLSRASVGGPALPPRPLAADSLDRALDAAVRRFMQDPRKYRFEDGVLYLNRMLDWGGGSFGPWAEGRVPEEGSTTAGDAGAGPGRYAAAGVFFAGYEDGDVAEALLAGEYRVELMEYDWALDGY